MSTVFVLLDIQNNKKISFSLKLNPLYERSNEKRVCRNVSTALESVPEDTIGELPITMYIAVMDCISYGTFDGRRCYIETVGNFWIETF